MPLHRVRTTWTGWPGGPGVTTFYFPSTSAPPIDAVNTFWTAIKAYFPAVVKWQVENTGSTINEADGSLVGTWSGPQQTAVFGTGTGTYLTTTGPMITWGTQTVHGRKMLKGRTFLSPFIIAGITPSGRIDSAPYGTIKTAAQNLVAGGRMSVWGRPSQPGKGTLVGQAASIVSADCTDFPAVLRSRRQ